MTVDECLRLLNEALVEFSINTRHRIAAFLGNVAVESGEFRWMEEIWGPTAAQAGYEGRADLGNTQRGDGYRYRGRGPIQLTGRANYREVGRALDLDLEGNPDRVATPKVGFRVACHFWRHRSALGDLNEYADRGDFDSTVRGVQGAYPNLANKGAARRAYYNAALNALPATIEVSRADTSEPVTISEDQKARRRGRRSRRGEPVAQGETEAGVLTIKEGTNLYEGFRYIEPAIGRTRYEYWKTNIVPTRGPTWAINQPVPPIEEVIAEGIFCAGVPNLFLRKVGKRVPIRDDYTQFDGGTATYFGDNLFGPGYFAGYMESFNLQTAKRWAEETRSGVLVGRRFVWTSGGQVASEGHVGIVLPSGYVLQAYPGAGLNWDVTIEDSHDGFYYEVMVHPENWIDYEGDEF